MSITIILIIIGLAIAFFLSLKLLRGVFKAILTVFLLLIILVGVFGIIIYSDAMTLKKGLQGQKTIFLIHDENIIAGFSSSDVSSNNIIGKSIIDSYNEQKIKDYNEKYKDKKLEDEFQEGLILIINSEFMEDKEINLEEIQIKFDKERLDKFAEAKTSKEIAETLTDSTNRNVQLYTEYVETIGYDAQDFKNKVLFAFIVDQSKTTKGKFLFDGVKSKSITTHPKLISIKMINMFPSKLYNKLIDTITKE